jgi:hypothetical protein
MPTPAEPLGRDADERTQWLAWCAHWFGPDSDETYLAKAVRDLPSFGRDAEGVEGLADCYGDVMLDANGRKSWEFDGRGLHELAARLQPARVPDEQYIRFDYLDGEGREQCKMITHEDMRQRYAELFAQKNILFAAAPALEDVKAGEGDPLRKFAEICARRADSMVDGNLLSRVAEKMLEDDPAPESRGPEVPRQRAAGRQRRRPAPDFRRWREVVGVHEDRRDDVAVRPGKGVAGCGGKGASDESQAHRLARGGR